MSVLVNNQELVFELIRISAIISENWFDQIRTACCDESIERTCDLKFRGYYGATEIVQEITVAFYKKYEDELGNDQEDWIHVFQNEGVHDYKELVAQWSKSVLSEHYNINVIKRTTETTNNKKS